MRVQPTKYKGKKVKKIDEKKTTTDIIKVADETKREFIKKFGKYAASAPLAGIVLMTAGTSKAHAGSDTGP